MRRPTRPGTARNTATSSSSATVSHTPAPPPAHTQKRRLSLHPLPHPPPSQPSQRQCLRPQAIQSRLRRALVKGRRRGSRRHRAAQARPTRAHCPQKLRFCQPLRPRICMRMHVRRRADISGPGHGCACACTHRMVPSAQAGLARHTPARPADTLGACPDGRVCTHALACARIRVCMCVRREVRTRLRIPQASRTGLSASTNTEYSSRSEPLLPARPCAATLSPLFEPPRSTTARPAPAHVISGHHPYLRTERRAPAPRLAP